LYSGATFHIFYSLLYFVEFIRRGAHIEAKSMKISIPEMLTITGFIDEGIETQ